MCLNSAGSKIFGVRQLSKRSALSCLLIFAWLITAYFLFDFSDGVHDDRAPEPVAHFATSKQRTIPGKAHYDVVDPDDGQTWPYRVYKSDSARPPRVDIMKSGAELADGYLFVNTQLVRDDNELDHTPYIFSMDGELVFAAPPADNAATANFRVQTYRGRPHLTTWRGTLTEGQQVGHAYGEVVFYDEEYEETVMGIRDDSINANMADAVLAGYVDLHEQKMTDWGSILVMVYNATTTNASHIGAGEELPIFDGVIYEIDIATQNILWTWSALNHISIEDSLSPLNLSVHGKDASAVPWDGFHLNSIDPAGPNHFLISSRSTWCIYLVDRHDGSIVWTLQGNHGGDFGQLPANGSFLWQHDARMLAWGEGRMVISLFDNHRNDSASVTTLSRGTVLELDLPPDSSRPPKVLRSTHVANGSAAWQGSFQAELSNGNELLSLGDKPYVVEFGSGPNGMREEVWCARFGYDGHVPTYRGLKFPWRGTPRKWDPSLVAEVNGLDGDTVRVTAYVSWNGATDVQHWQLFTTIDGWPNMEKAGIIAKHGFETMFEIELEQESCLYVVAVSGLSNERLSNLVCL